MVLRFIHSLFYNFADEFIIDLKWFPNHLNHQCDFKTAQGKHFKIALGFSSFRGPGESLGWNCCLSASIQH